LYTLIDSLDDLSVLNQELLKKGFVGIDTEFRRTTKDNMRLALLQVNDGEEIYLIDAVKIPDPLNYCSFLHSKDVTKIIHSCKEDVEAIHVWTLKKICNVFDTQLAHSFLEDEYSISYQGLVKKKLDIQLEKKETRSNWIRRPLSEAQLKYAALDVEYLIHLYLSQLKSFEGTKKLDWHNQDTERMINFNHQLSFDLKRTLPKTQEDSILRKFNKIIEEKAKLEGINQTLFFSKKAQKDFLRSILINGLDEACMEITPWRVSLIREEILELLK
jgi:ribonuclease D